MNRRATSVRLAPEDLDKILATIRLLSECISALADRVAASGARS